jgi:hypothetical protein
VRARRGRENDNGAARRGRTVHHTDRTRSILGAAGFGEITFDAAEELMYSGATADDAYRFVRGLSFTDWMLQGLDDAARSSALGALRATIEAHATDRGVLYPSAVWMVTART